jgi:uncharacterized membrane protein YdjX (TVP38/TMEM64 family)
MSTRIRIALLMAALLAVLASSFLVVQALGVTLLEDPNTALDGGGTWPAVLGVSLLVVDALLPVPSSVVMISLGALYGAALGATLAFAGRFGMAVLGLALGRAGAPIVLKLIGRPRGAHAYDLVEHWGAFSIIVSRPVPLLAEAVVLAAGAARLPWRVALAAAFVGSLPEAIAYAAIGAAATSAANGALIWLAFLFVGTLFRFAELAVRRSGRRGAARAVVPSRMRAS